MSRSFGLAIGTLCMLGGDWQKRWETYSFLIPQFELKRELKK